MPVKKLPNPYTMIGSSEGGNMPINQFKAQIGIRVISNYADMGWCSNSYGCELVHYSLKVIRNGKEIFNDTTLTTIYYNDKIKSFVENTLQKGDTVIFYSFVCLLFKKEVRKLNQEMKFVMTD